MGISSSVPKRSLEIFSGSQTCLEAFEFGRGYDLDFSSMKEVLGLRQNLYTQQKQQTIEV